MASVVDRRDPLTVIITEGPRFGKPGRPRDYKDRATVCFAYWLNGEDPLRAAHELSKMGRRGGLYGEFRDLGGQSVRDAVDASERPHGRVTGPHLHFLMNPETAKPMVFEGSGVVLSDAFRKYVIRAGGTLVPDSICYP